jgi:hypothetical protein
MPRRGDDPADSPPWRRGPPAFEPEARAFGTWEEGEPGPAHLLLNEQQLLRKWKCTAYFCEEATRCRPPPRSGAEMPATWAFMFREADGYLGQQITEEPWL